MHPKIKSRPAGEEAPVRTVKPLMLHDVTNQTASANAASRRRLIATQPTSGTANHARDGAARKSRLAAPGCSGPNSKPKKRKPADSLSEHSAEALSNLRARFGAAQERFADVYEGAKKKVVAGAKCTDEAIRANPYEALAIALGAGLLAGVLLGRRSK